MPELPEVETIKLFLAQNIIGLKIKSIEVLNSKSFIGDYKLLIDKKIKSVARRAKVLRIGFDKFELLIHLKMSGQLIFKGGKEFIGGHPTKDMFGEVPNKSTRVIFNFSNGAKLFFNDQRKFGWIKISDKRQVTSDKFFSLMGPEPLDESFSWQVLKQKLLKRKNTPVKVTLLDQTIVAGVGNIYACEACFLAGVYPRKKVLELADKEFKKLHQGVIQSLQNGIKYGGSSKTHFINPEGKRGVFLDFAYVYGREKLPCKKCRNLIKKIKLGGRGTYFCDVCQK